MQRLHKKIKTNKNTLWGINSNNTQNVFMQNKSWCSYEIFTSVQKSVVLQQVYSARTLEERAQSDDTPWWTQVDPPSMAWDPPGGPNWKLPGVVHTHPEVRQQWVNTAEGMQEARIRAKHLEKQTTRMQGWVCERVQYRGTKYTKTKEEGTWGDLPGIVNMWLVSRDMLALQ